MWHFRNSRCVIQSWRILAFVQENWFHSFCGVVEVIPLLFCFPFPTVLSTSLKVLGTLMQLNNFIFFSWERISQSDPLISHIKDFNECPLLSLYILNSHDFFPPLYGLLAVMRMVFLIHLISMFQDSLISTIAHCVSSTWHYLGIIHPTSSWTA